MISVISVAVDSLNIVDFSIGIVMADLGDVVSEDVSAFRELTLSQLLRFADVMGVDFEVATLPQISRGAEVLKAQLDGRETVERSGKLTLKPIR